MDWGLPYSHTHFTLGRHAFVFSSNSCSTFTSRLISPTWSPFLCRTTTTIGLSTTRRRRSHCHFITFAILSRMTGRLPCFGSDGPVSSLDIFSSMCRVVPLPWWMKAAQISSGIGRRPTDTRPAAPAQPVLLNEGWLKLERSHNLDRYKSESRNGQFGWWKIVRSGRVANGSSRVTALFLIVKVWLYERWWYYYEIYDSFI